MAQDVSKDCSLKKKKRLQSSSRTESCEFLRAHRKQGAVRVTEIPTQLEKLPPALMGPKVCPQMMQD